MGAASLEGASPRGGGQAADAAARQGATPGTAPEAGTPEPEPVTLPTVTLPRLVASDASLALWHKTDDIFRRPKTNLFIELVAPAAYHAPSNAVLTRLFTKLISDELTEFRWVGLGVGVA